MFLPGYSPNSNQTRRMNMSIGPFDRRKRRSRCDACSKSRLKVCVNIAIALGDGI